MLAACRLGGGKGVGRPRRMQRAGEGLNGDRWGRASAERAENMYCISVTLDKLRLSGWLNADAPCRVARSAIEVGGMRAERWKGRGAGAVHAACRRGPEWGSAGRGTRGAHPKHALHGCDAGRVEAQRLLEHRRVLPSRKKRI